MPHSFTNFSEFFRAAFLNQDPFYYQSRLAIDVKLPSLVNVPTGAGKTAAILAAWLWRRLNAPDSIGRRLVYCLPMRTLVEQTHGVAAEALKNLGLQDQIGLHKLLGGDVSLDWDMRPERQCILIGTQDMLLSRALNRGYAMSRFRWPVHFGLLNNDCLWVFDEIQLMGDGLATTSQLAAFRERFKHFGPVDSIWMSATLDKDWLRTIDFASQVDELKPLELSDDDRKSEVLAKRLNAPKHLHKADPTCRQPTGLAEFVKRKHLAGTQSLIVVNTVDRAREVYDELNKAYGRASSKSSKKPSPLAAERPAENAVQIVLIHSRFRPPERRFWQKLFNEKTDASGPDRIIVATQVIEAGVDMTSRLLITDLAPFSSLVQRFGRCNREGNDGDAEVWWIDRPLTEKTLKLADKTDLSNEELDKLALPYTRTEIYRAEDTLERLQSVSPSVLEDVDYRAPYTPQHVLRRRDLVDLFDTTSELSGYDLDISRFVREGDERDVLVAWREIGYNEPGRAEPKLARDELCHVPLIAMRDFIKNSSKAAWTWDAFDGKWHKITKANLDLLRPGLTLLLDVDAGGYDEKRGWDGKSKEPVSIVASVADENEAYVDDPLTFRNPITHIKYNQTLAAHSLEARQAAERILKVLYLAELDEVRDELLTATQHHDWGKAHKVFQATLYDVPRDVELDNLELEPQLAKSTSAGRHRRKLFRHELASALALLQTGASALTVYLAACHHGKVRLSIRALPGETKPKDRSHTRFARGIWHGDELPEAHLGNGLCKKAVKLDLEPMFLGRSVEGGPSWLELMLALRDRFGVFRLAYLECLIRAADVQASSEPRDILPTLVETEAKQ